jgi:ubiquinone biosynthesis protein
MLLAPRHLPRLAAVLGLLTRYGLGDLAPEQGLLPAPPGSPGDEPPVPEGQAERARAFRDRLVALGPAYVKLGQVLASRPDLVPEAYVRELATLQDDVERLPFDTIREIVETSLGASIGKLFPVFDETPIAAASLGQVHLARLRDDRAVAVKVQRPGIREGLAEDLAFFREAARFLAEHTGAGRRVDLVAVVQQMERALAEELDYRTEARNITSFRRALAEYPDILVPRVIEGLSTDRVLTVERVRGTKISEIPPVARLDWDFAPLAEQFSLAYLKQIAIDGHFHADPHPGNVFLVFPGRENPPTAAEEAQPDLPTRRPTAHVTPLSELEQVGSAPPPVPERAERPRLALIDFGMTGRLSPAMRDRVVQLLLDLAEDRGDQAGETLIEMGEPLPEFERERFLRELAALVTTHHDRSVGEVQAGELVFGALRIASERGLRVPAELTLMGKTLLSLDAIARALDPSFNPIDTVRSYTGRIVSERMRRELSPQRIFQTATQTSRLVQSLPRRLDTITERMASGEFGLRIDAPQVTQLLEGLQKVANRVLSGLVVAGLLVASAMLLPERRALGTAGFVIAAALGLYMVGTILLHDRSERRRLRRP